MGRVVGKIDRGQRQGKEAPGWKDPFGEEDGSSRTWKGGQWGAWWIRGEPWGMRSGSQAGNWSRILRLRGLVAPTS